MTGIGAFEPLPNIPANVGLPNRQPPLGLGDGDYSSCPGAVSHKTPALWDADVLMLLGCELAVLNVGVEK
jgi:hypothetical protein